MADLWMLADDVTGALDAGVHLAEAGIPTLVRLVAGAAGADGRPGEPAALVLATESRHLPPQQAGALVRALAAGARRAGAQLVYKKTDSALRGNVAAELAALAAAFPGEALWFAPAFPGAGRVTKGGLHYIDGTPVAESPFGRDPFTPVAHSHVGELLRAGGYAGPLAAVPAGELPPAGRAGILIFDAETDEDLRAIALAAKAGGVRLLAGCAGFAAQLPVVMGRGRAWGKQDAPAEKMALPRRLVSLSGSLNPAAMAQAAHAARQGFCACPIDDGVRFAAPEDSAAIEAFARKVWAEAAGRDVALYPDGHSALEGMDEDEARRLVAANLGRLAKALLAAGPPCLLMVTGGDTLLAVLGQLGVAALVPVAQLSPGVVLARPAGGGAPLVAKSGGLGGQDVLAEVRRWMDAQDGP